jgi:hypothetical protein
MKRLLASDMWPMFTAEAGNARLARLLRKIDPAIDSLVEGLLLYDEVVIPTQDFTVIPALMSVLGEAQLRELVESGALKFTRMKGTLILTPNGLAQARISREGGQPHPFAADLDWTIGWACEEFARASEHRALATAIRSVTAEVDAGTVVESVKPELASDLASSSELRMAVGLADLDFRQLPPNAVHLYGGPELPSAIPGVDGFLRAAQCNAEIDLAVRSGCDDIASAAEIDVVIRAKLDREHRGEAAERLLQIASVPDYAPLVRQKVLPLAKLLKLRSSRDGEAFRAWVHNALIDDDPIEIARAYTSLLRSTDAVDGTTGRILRAITWTAATTPVGMAAAGVPGAALGAAAGLCGSLIDTFVVSKLRLKGFPIVFLDRLRDLAEHKDGA